MERSRQAPYFLLFVSDFSFIYFRPKTLSKGVSTCNKLRDRRLGIRVDLQKLFNNHNNAFKQNN